MFHIQIIRFSFHSDSCPIPFPCPTPSLLRATHVPLVNFLKWNPAVTDNFLSILPSLRFTSILSTISSSYSTCSALAFAAAIFISASLIPRNGNTNQDNAVLVASDTDTAPFGGELEGGTADYGLGGGFAIGMKDTTVVFCTTLIITKDRPVKFTFVSIAADFEYLNEGPVFPRLLFGLWTFTTDTYSVVSRKTCDAAKYSFIPVATVGPSLLKSFRRFILTVYL
ncbi:hypothetical protein WG66_011602 [Moniliophthora roreri]|nr:hypothetical protein WG66_011602 [Moniliophthora roreri]